MHRTLILTAAMAACSFAAEPAVPPSKVVNPVTESALPALQLTAQAVQRLGIATGQVERKSFPRSVRLTGTVRIPAGDATDPLAPAPVSGPEELRKLAELQSVADGAAATAAADLQAAGRARKRAEALSGANAGSERAAEEARAVEARAKIALETATRNRALLGRPAAELLAAGHRWIAVTIPAAEVAKVDLTKPVKLTIPGAPPSAAMEAKPVARPSSGLPGGSIEVFFESEHAGLVPGQALSVEAAEKSGPAAAPSLSVPWSAVVFDATGGAWVYEQKAPEIFVRRRVAIVRVHGPDAELSSGPAEGTKVVRTGGAELFGAEFGGFK